MCSAVLSDEEIIDWLQLYMSNGVGPRLFYQLIKNYGTVRDALGVLPDLCSRTNGLRNVSIISRDIASREYEHCLAFGVKILLSKTDFYPSQLKSLADVPPVLFTKGNLDLLQRPMVAMVGARNAAVHSQKFALRLAGDLSDRGIVVVSGLARGIDTAVHNGALAGGTVAVIANGLDLVYPHENKGLSNAIAHDGLVISEFPLGTSPKAGFFPRRNRIISGLSQVVVIVEAALSSGSLITARYALEQGREVGAVPGSPVDPRSQGTNSLIKQGAFVVENVDDVLAFFPFSAKQADPLVLKKEVPYHTDIVKGNRFEQEAAQKILSLLGLVPIDIDVLLLEMSIAPNVLLAILLELELAGKVKRCSGNKVVLAT